VHQHLRLLLLLLLLLLDRQQEQQSNVRVWLQAAGLSALTAAERCLQH
jgi:hypothetical protein